MEKNNRPVDQPRNRRLDYMVNLSGYCLELCTSKMKSVLVDQEVWLNLELLTPKKGRKKNRPTGGIALHSIESWIFASE